MSFLSRAEVKNEWSCASIIAGLYLQNVGLELCACSRDLSLFRLFSIFVVGKSKFVCLKCQYVILSAQPASHPVHFIIPNPMSERCKCEIQNCVDNHVRNEH